MSKTKRVRIAPELSTHLNRALELERDIKARQTELNDIRTVVCREAALNLSSGTTEVVLEGICVTARVVFPRCNYLIDEDRVLELKGILGDKFDRYVRVEHRVQPGYHAFLQDQQGPLCSVLRSIVQPESTDSRVTFGAASPAQNKVF